MFAVEEKLQVHDSKILRSTNKIPTEGQTTTKTVRHIKGEDGSDVEEMTIIEETVVYEEEEYESGEGEVNKDPKIFKKEHSEICDRNQLKQRQAMNIIKCRSESVEINTNQQPVNHLDIHNRISIRNDTFNQKSAFQTQSQFSDSKILTSSDETSKKRKKSTTRTQTVKIIKGEDGSDLEEEEEVIDQRIIKRKHIPTDHREKLNQALEISMTDKREHIGDNYTKRHTVDHRDKIVELPKENEKFIKKITVQGQSQFAERKIENSFKEISENNDVKMKNTQVKSINEKDGSNLVEDIKIQKKIKHDQNEIEDINQLIQTFENSISESKNIIN